MKTPDKYKPTIKVKGIQDYINSKREVENNTFIIAPDGNFYLQDGKRIPEDLFLKVNKVELQKSAIFKGEGLDGRSKWID